MSAKLGLPLLTPAQAAAHLAISTRQLRDLTQAGSIRYVNIGQRDRETRRYAPEDLAAFIEERRCQSQPGGPRARPSSQGAYEIIDFTALTDERRGAKQRAKTTR